MASIQTIFLYNFLKRMSHKDRIAGVRDLMNAWPDDWLDDAIQIAQEIRQRRKILIAAWPSPTTPDPGRRPIP